MRQAAISLGFGHYFGEEESVPYINIKVRQELHDLIFSCKLPGEPISDTLRSILDPVRVQERQKAATAARKGDTDE